MKLFEKNLDIVKQTNPGLFNKILSGAVQDAHTLELVQSKSFQPTLWVQKNGHKILLHSSYDPVSEASRFVSSFEINKETKLVIVYGVGFGYHVIEILRRLSSEAKLILIEKDERILQKALENVDFSFLADARVSLYCGEFDINDLWYSIYQMYFPKLPDAKKIVFVPHFSSLQVYPEYYRDMGEKIRDYISRIAVVINTHIHVSKDWSVNTLKNMDEIIINPPVKMLYGKNQGKPAILVSAGPSLDKNIDALREVQDRALIIAVGTSLKPLLKRGIKPHLVVAIDAHVKHFDHFKDINIPKDVALVYDGMIYPRILDEFPGNKFTCDTTEGPLKHFLYNYFGERGVLVSGFSVATAAFSLAKEMGSSPIILVGQDLSFRKDGHTHAQGTTFEKDVVNTYSLKLIPIRGNVEPEVLTTHVFLSTLRWFEEAISQTGIRCVNATEGGAVISGCEVMPLEEAVNKFCKVKYPFEYLNEMPQTHRKNIKKESLLGAIEKLDRGIFAVEEMRDISGNGATRARELLDIASKGVDENSEEFQKTAKIVQEYADLLRTKEEGSFFLDAWLQEVYVFLHRSQHGLKELSEYSRTIQELNRAGVLFEGIHKASLEVLPLLWEGKRNAEKVYKRLFEKEKFEKKFRIVTFGGMEHSMMLKYIHEDFVMALKELGHEVFSVDLPENFIITGAFLEKINEYKPDIVFTLDNHALHPDFVQMLHVPVISFCMDDPHKETSMEWNRTNFFMFVTEADDAIELREIGFPNVYNLPIGANEKRFYFKPADEIPEKYHCDVSFVALSLSKSFKDFHLVPPKAKPQLNRLVAAQSQNLLKPIQDVISLLRMEKSFKYDERYTLEHGFLFLIQKATALHRLNYLLKIPRIQCNFKLFGDEGWKTIFRDAPYFGRVDYGTELKDVYNASKINIGLNNYGLAGIHARVLDAALCKAFGLYEYTPGLEKYFTYGEDVVWFKTPEEMAEKIEFYLAHPEERKRIAENAYRNVMENHTTLSRARKMLDTVIQEM